MKAHLKGLDMWQLVEGECNLPPLENNPTSNQIRLHEKKHHRELYQLSFLEFQDLF